VQLEVTAAVVGGVVGGTVVGGMVVVGAVVGGTVVVDAPAGMTVLCGTTVVVTGLVALVDELLVLLSHAARSRTRIPKLAEIKMRCRICSPPFS
jgi:hypothetical protein